MLDGWLFSTLVHLHLWFFKKNFFYFERERVLSLFNCSRNVGIGESSLDRISCSLGGKAVLAPFLQLVSQLISDRKFFLKLWAFILF